MIQPKSVSEEQDFPYENLVYVEHGVSVEPSKFSEKLEETTLNFRHGNTPETVFLYRNTGTLQINNRMKETLNSG